MKAGVIALCLLALMLFLLALPYLIAATVAAVGSWAIVAWGPVDRPGARTSHHRPTATSGGLAILASASLGLLVFAVFTHGPFVRPAALAMGFACAFGLFGAWDDVADLGARLKLGLGALLGLVFTTWVAPIQALPLTDTLSLPLGPALGALGGALWIVTATNAVNFMDGANGVAPGGTAVALAALSAAAFAAGDLGVGAAAMAGAAATAGFLPFNLKGRLFQGDAGALFAGFLFAALCLVACGRDGRGPVGLWFGPTALLPFLTDVLLTLLRRARGRRSLLQAHREHLYQRWLAADPGHTHASLALRTSGAMLAAAALALAFEAASGAAPAVGFGLGVLAASLAWRSAGRRLPSGTGAEDASGAGRSAMRGGSEPPDA